MLFFVTGFDTSGSISLRRDTQAGALKKARELMADGCSDVHVSIGNGTKFFAEQFHLVPQNSEKPPSLKLGEKRILHANANLRLLLALNDVAEALPRFATTFDDGSSLVRNFSEMNAARFASENPSWTMVQGWLIAGTCIFTKHSVVADHTGRLFEITPHADELPFARHFAACGDYSSLASEINLLNESISAI